MKRLIALVVLIVAAKGLFAQYGDYSVRVEVAGNGYAHFTIVYFDDESWDPNNPPTYGWDACCDALLNMGNPWQPHVFTQVVAPPVPVNNHRISINGLPHVFEHTEVPMGFLPGELAQYTFTFKELYTLPIGMTVELEDHGQNVVQDLLADSVYTTWAATSDDEERFTLHFYPENVTSTTETLKESQSLSAWYNSEKLIVTGFETIQTAKIYDMFGKEVWQTTGQNQLGELIIDRNEIASGIYVLEIISLKMKRQTLKITI